MGYDYEIKYKLGKENIAADTLSRTLIKNSTQWLSFQSLPISWVRLQGPGKKINTYKPSFRTYKPLQGHTLITPRSMVI
jgi:hypothetical protein